MLSTPTITQLLQNVRAGAQGRDTRSSGLLGPTDAQFYRADGMTANGSAAICAC